MTDWSLAGIRRYPVKGLGGEVLGEVDLAKGKAIPFDRRWAVAHGNADTVSGWAEAGNFVGQRHAPRFAQIGAAFSPRNHRLELSHPDLEDLVLQPGTPDGDDALSAWIDPLVKDTPLSGPFLVYEWPDGAYTDYEEAHISIASEASRRALGQMLGTQLDHARFRMGLWLEGLAPWEELDWVGCEVEVGEARLKVTMRDERCNVTNANPATGTRDTQIPAVLRQQFGHMDFGVYAQVVSSGKVRAGDPARLV